jgi:hypothetical protein
MCKNDPCKKDPCDTCVTTLYFNNINARKIIENRMPFLILQLTMLRLGLY